jgi:excisionase family DNA binding protein
MVRGRRGVELGFRDDQVPLAADHADSEVSLLLRPAEVAATLGLSRSKVFELLAARELPSLHIGRATRIPREQLQEWIQTQVSWQPSAPRGLPGRLQSQRISDS